MTIGDFCKLYRLDPLVRLQDDRLACFKCCGINKVDPQHAVYELTYKEDISRFSDPERGIFTGFGICKLNQEDNFRKLLLFNENGRNFYRRKHADGADDGPAKYTRGCVYRLFCELDLAEMEQIQDIVANNRRMKVIDLSSLLS